MSSPRILIPAMILLAAGFLGACSSDDGPTTPPGPQAPLSGTVRAGVLPADGATVYLAREPGFIPLQASIVIDSTVTDGAGRFAFDDLQPWLYRVYAAVYDAGGDPIQVSSFSGPLDLTGLTAPTKNTSAVVELSVLPMRLSGAAQGEVWFGDEAPAPVDSAQVTLYRYEGAQVWPAGETDTDEQGKFRFEGLRTANYTAWAMKVFDVAAPFPVYVSGETPPFFSPGTGTVTIPRIELVEAMVEKPAIYIHPEVPGTFSVKLGLANGTRLAFTEPEYGDGWTVAVAADGTIDGRWDYLFYEVGIRVWPWLERGWCVAREDLADRLGDLAASFGLNAAESEDFLAYWTTRLPDHPWYLVKPVFGTDLDTWVTLDVEPTPDTVLRFWMFFQGSDRRVDLAPPPLPRVARTGTVVVEWGGAVLPTPGS